MAELEQIGQAYTPAEERLRAQVEAFCAEGVAQGIELGIERERELLGHIVESKFGDAIGERVARLLAKIDDHGRLDDIGRWIIECEEGSELIERLNRVV